MSTTSFTIGAVHFLHVPASRLLVAASMARCMGMAPMHAETLTLTADADDCILLQQVYAASTLTAEQHAQLDSMLWANPELKRMLEVCNGKPIDL